MRTRRERTTPPAHHPVRGRMGAPLALLALLVALALGAGACGGSDSQYYDFNPNANSNAWPYFVLSTTESVVVDHDAGIVHIDDIYLPGWPVSSCASYGPSEVHFDVPLEAVANGNERHPTTQATVVSRITDAEFHTRSEEMAQQSPQGPLHVDWVDDEGIAWRVEVGGVGYSYVAQMEPPPYAILCDAMSLYTQTGVTSDGSPVMELVGSHALLCGYCGEARCGDNWCSDGETIDTCPEDCAPYPGP